jgi:hypothetical protein
MKHPITQVSIQDESRSNKGIIKRSAQKGRKFLALLLSFALILPINSPIQVSAAVPPHTWSGAGSEITVANGDTVTITSTSSGTLTVPAGVTVTVTGSASGSGIAFNLASTTSKVLWQAEYSSAAGATVSLEGSGTFTVSKGSIENTDNNTALSDDGQSLLSTIEIIKDGEVKASAEEGGIAIHKKGGYLLIDGGTVTASGDYGRAIYSANAAVTVKSGTVSTEIAEYAEAIHSTDQGTVTLSGGTVTAAYGTVLYNNSNIPILITGDVTMSGVIDFISPSTSTLVTIFPNATLTVPVEGLLTLAASGVTIQNQGTIQNNGDILNHGTIIHTANAVYDGNPLHASSGGTVTTRPTPSTVDDLQYNLITEPGGGNGTAEVVGLGAGFVGTTLAIPASIETQSKTYDVVGIADGAFLSSNITGLDLSNATKLKTIGDRAFEDSALSGTLTIPDSVTTIGVSAFEHTGLSGDLIIPDTVSTLGARAFSDCIGIGRVFLEGTSAPTCSGNPFIGLSAPIICPATAVGNYAIAFRMRESQLTRLLTITSEHIAGVNKLYDGTTEATVRISGFEVYGSEEVTVTVSGSFENATVGNGKTILLNGGTWSLGGDDADKYMLPDVLPTSTTGSILTDDPNTAWYVSQTAAGKGSRSNPYVITTADELASLAELVNNGVDNFFNRYVELNPEGDVMDLSAYSASYDEGKGWIPIGTESKPFRGTFDANYNVITGLYINRAADYQGLFGYTQGNILELGLYEVNVTGGDKTGALAGRATAGIINSFVSGNVEGTTNVGGMIGELSGDLSDNVSAVDVTGSGNYVGGVVGSINGGIAQHAIATGSVTGTDYVGGIAGAILGSDDNRHLYNGFALNSLVRGSTGVTHVGRVTGSNPNNNIRLNVAWIGMAGGPWTNVLGTGLDGENAEYHEIATRDIWSEHDHLSSLWGYTVGKLPTLTGFPLAYRIAQLPSHITQDALFGGGSGLSDDDPYLITEQKHLFTLAAMVNGGESFESTYFQLAKDITLQGAWTPIGTSSNHFKGIFDGNHKAIYGLTVTDSTYRGLFGNIEGNSTSEAAATTGIVRDLAIINANITGTNYIGILAGEVDNGLIEGCYASGSISGTTWVGGMVGYFDGTIRDSRTDAVVQGSDNHVGGIVGWNQGVIERSIAAGSVRSTAYSPASANPMIGGIAGGGSATATITDCASLPILQYYNTNSGRVRGTGVGTLARNFAWSGMTGAWINKGADKKDGADADSDALIDDAIWSTFDESSKWAYTAGGIPVPAGFASGLISAALPTHISAFEGEGTAASPYRIEDEADLRKLAELVNGGESFSGEFIKLQNDITLTQTWTPIGTSAKPFSGTFNGGYHIVSNVAISLPSDSYVGFFGVLDGAHVENLGLNVNISGGTTGTGGVAGCLKNSSQITRCFVTGSVSGVSAGGIVGTFSSGSVSVSDSYSKAAVTASSYGGGIVGEGVYGASILRCYCTGAISGNGISTTGMIGDLGTIENSVVLSPEIVFGTYGARIAHRGATGGDGSYTNNFAWNGISVPSDYTTTTSSSRNGADWTSAQIAAANNWTGLGYTGDNGWTTANNALPILAGFEVGFEGGRQSSAIPAYIISPTTVSITEEPSSVIANEGTTATFTANAAGTSPSFQWQVSTDNGENWANVSGGSGGTTATYITGTLVASDHGKQYRVVASEGVQTATSASATLTLIFLPEADDFDVTGLEAIWSGYPKVVTVSVKDTVTGMGSITAVKYNGSTTIPSDAGSYPITIDVAAGSAYTGVNSLAVGTLEIANATPTPAKPAASNITANGFKIANTYDTATYGYIQYQLVVAAGDGFDEEGTWTTYSSGTGIIELLPNTAYSLRVRYAGDAPYIASAASSIATITTMKPTLAGTVVTSGVAKYGEMLSAVTSNLRSEPSLGDLSNLGTLSYQWKRGTTNIGTNSADYTLVEDDIGANITVIITAANCSGSVTSLATSEVAKADQSAPAQPTMASRTTNSITLTAITGAEYRRGDQAGSWQDAATFSGLTSGTAYTFYARLKATNTHNASSESVVSASIAALKASQSAPGAPTLGSKSATEVTLVAPTAESTFEYARSTINTAPASDSNGWQSSLTFSALDPNTTYYFFARLAGTATHEPSPGSESLSVTTDKALLTGTPTISDTTPQFGDTLSAVTTTLAAQTGGSIGALSYVWENGDGDTLGTGSTYTVLASDIGETITVTVTAANCNGDATSEATSAVAKADAPTLTWPMAGEVTYGETLAESALSVSGNDYGTFAWTDDTIEPAMGNTTGYEVTFTPSANTLAWYETIALLTKNITVTVNPVAASTLTIDSITAVTYTGSAHQPTIVVKDGSTTLTLTSDYTVAYSNNINAGTATVTITGVGNYSGTKSATFTIQKATAPAISTWPSSATGITYGQTLANATLNVTSDTNGTFAWTLPAAIPTVAQSGNTFSVTYTPSDAVNYDYSAMALTTQIAVTVNQNSTVSGNDLTVSVSKGIAREYNFDLTALLPNIGSLSFGTVTYAPQINTNAEGVLDTTRGTTLGYTSGNTLTLPILSVAEGKSATILVTISSVNYADFTANITVTSSDLCQVAHTPGTAATCTTAQTCTVCGQVIAAAIGHNYASEWSSDASNHWKACSVCGNQGNLSAHIAGEWVTDVAATATTEGHKYKPCSICEYLLEEATIPATGEANPDPNPAPELPAAIINPPELEFWWDDLANDDAGGSGAGQRNENTFVMGSNEPLRFVIDKDISLLERVRVDDSLALIPGVDYIAQSGSTITNLQASYLNTLSAGTHYIYVEFGDNVTARGEFTVSATPLRSPKTSDKESMLPYYLMGGSLWIALWSAVCGMMIWKRRGQQHRRDS